MAHPRIEEVEDSDEGYSDPSEGDIDDFDEGDILRAVEPRSQTQQPKPTQTQTQRQPPQPSRASAAAAAAAQRVLGDGPPPSYGSFAALYPVYFDSARSRAEGRRVGRALAVANPLAREIVTACANLGLRTVFEPTKTHPKDWANPGRVRVDLASATATVHNKHHLYLLVARHLAAHPTTDDSAGLREQVRGAPPPPPRGQPYPRPAVPRGWKMGPLVPYLSPAMTGGGVSENLFQDVIKEMQGAGSPGGPSGGPAGLAGMAGMGGLGGMGAGMPDMQRAMQALSGGAEPPVPPTTTKKTRKGKGRS
ncbi:signal recognition particle [Grosmannia clavigera kw1407]|uniref:Signal recognition particle n=1 Tax=Grosmannia clavigera (strain kw1407 / UAMH 11150) TaxID=655863 RepID=F0XD58_GROCL|nr:signal recognition particle [Grosmannia clavigera kw1407]EFX04638.1 signal recognition particle [Grosmannia clavigera kw1407]